MSGDIFAGAIPLFWSQLGENLPLFLMVIGAAWLQYKTTA